MLGEVQAVQGHGEKHAIARGFTLIEVLIVITLVVVLASVGHGDLSRTACGARAKRC